MATSVGQGREGCEEGLQRAEDLELSLQPSSCREYVVNGKGASRFLIP